MHIYKTDFYICVALDTTRRVKSAFK